MILYLVRHGIAIDREDPKCPSDTEAPSVDAEGNETEPCRRAWVARHED